MIYNTLEFLFRPHALVRETLPREGDSGPVKRLREDAAKLLAHTSLVGVFSAANFALLSMPEAESGSSWVKAAGLVVGVCSAIAAGGMYGTVAQEVGSAHAAEEAAGIDCQVIAPFPEISFTPPDQA